MTVGSVTREDSPRYRDEEVLRRLYWDEELNSYEVADRFGVSGATITKWMDRLGVPTRPQTEAQKLSNGKNRASYRTTVNGYEQWTSSNSGGESKHVFVHRLVAVAEFGFDTVAGTHVHHDNGVRWDNRPSNLKVLSPGEHAKHHVESDYERGLGGFVTPGTGGNEERPEYHKEEVLRELYEEQELTLVEVGERFDTSGPTIRYWLQKHGIERRPSRHKRISEEDLLEELKDVAERVGGTPIQSDMTRYGKHAKETYKRRFGSWENALAKAEIAAYLARRRRE